MHDRQVSAQWMFILAHMADECLAIHTGHQDIHKDQIKT